MYYFPKIQHYGNCQGQKGFSPHKSSKATGKHERVCSEGSSGEFGGWFFLKERWKKSSLRAKSVEIKQRKERKKKETWHPKTKLMWQKHMIIEFKIFSPINKSKMSKRSGKHHCLYKFYGFKKNILGSWFVQHGKDWQYWCFYHFFEVESRPVLINHLQNVNIQNKGWSSKAGFLHSRLFSFLLQSKHII